MGQVAAPLEKLLSLANANLKDLWVELTDNDGVQLKDENGITSAIRIVFNFVVLGENSQSWETMDEDMLYSERKTKLNSKVSSAVSSLIQTPDEHELAVSEFQRLQETFENQIPLEGMTQAAKVMSVTMSVEVLMLRMLINTASGEHVSEFDEFCKVLKILPKDYPSEEYQEEGISEGENLTENLTILENEAAREKIVKMDLDPVVGLRVVFTRDALNRFPELMHDSGWSLKDGPGVGTILWVNPYDLDGDGMVGDICQVLWQKTGKKGHYKTGYHGEYHLAAFEPPKPRLDEKQLSRLKDEFVVQKDLPASIGMRVVARKLSLALFPELEEQSRGQVGTIVWIQPAFVKGDVLIEQGATVEVVWGPSKKRCVVQTGLNNNYQLALHEEKSAITLDEISRLEGKHAFSFLQTLILDDNHIGDRGASSLGESLKGNWMLKTLSLKRNRIAREGGNQLGLGLQHKNVLRELNLSQNTLRDDGILELCHALLLKTCPLQKLDLESNQISYAGCRMLAKALMGTNNMSQLILKNNLVGSDGAGLLEQGIRRSASLQCLDISGNVLGNFGFRALMRSLRRIPPGRGKKAQPGNRSLVSIDVSNNNLNDDCINELEETLLKNRTLLYLTTDNNVFSEEGLYKIGRILASNKRHAQLEKAVVLLQCLFRGRKERLARANARGQQLELRESKAPEVGDRVNVDNLQGNLKRYNGKFGMIESLEFDIDHRQWVNVKLEDNIRALPIRCLRRCVTVVKTPDATNVESSKQQKDKKRDALPATVKIENALGNLDSVSEVDHHKESEGTDENRVKQNAESMEKEFLIGSAGFETKSGPELRDQKGAGESDVTTPQDKAGVPAISASATKLSETPRSGSSGVSSMSGISDLARESLDLLNKLPGSDSEGLVNSILQFESPLAGALLRKIARKEWPASAGVRPTTQHQVNENEWLESVSQSDRPRTYGGKSIKEQDLMLAAARLTLVNMGDALMQQQKAAEEIAMEASRRCMEAAEHYASLEVHLKAVIVSEDTSEEDVKIALQALADAEEAAIRTIEQAEEADEAARRALHATKKFQQFESEEEELEKAISGLNRHEDDDDDADLPTDRRPMSGISEVSKYDSPSARARSVASSKSPRKVTERSSHSSGDGSHMGSIQDDATSQILSNTRSTGMDVAACFKRLKCVLEDSEEDGESVEAAVAEFNRAQDEAMLAFDLAIKSVEEETSTIRVYQEDSRTFVETVRQEMSEAYERLQTAQDANGDEAEFVDALTEFFERSAHISQLVIRAEIFRLGSSLSRSSSGGGSVTSSVTREVAVREEADMRLRFMLNEAMCKPWRCVNKAAITPIGDDFYTSREEAAAILIQSLLRGARTRWKNRITHTKPERQIHSQMVSIHDKQYSEEEVNAAIKIQGLSRGSRDRSRVHTMKRLGRTPVGKQYLEFIDSQPDEVVERMHQIATKVQSIHRGSMTRKRMTSGSVMEDVLGLDMLSKSESARQARRHLAERLACGHGADADDLNRDEERLRNDLASEMMTRHSQPDGGRKNPPAGSPGHHASHRREIEHVFGLHHEENVEDNPNIRDDSHDGPDQPYNAGKKRGSVDKGAVMGFLQGIGECLMSFNESPEKKESEYIDALKAEKYQNHLRQDDDVSRHRAEIDELLHSDHKLTKHEQEIIDADREAGKMMSKIRLQALHELEDALGEGLLDNLEYDNPDENDDETDSPTEHQGKSIVSFPTLREFKIMQARSNLPVKEEVLVLKVAAKGLANLDGLLGKSDPYLKFLRKEPDGSHTNVGQTTIIQNDLNPIWPVVELKMDSLCFNDREHEFRIECWDSDASAFNPLDLNKDDLIGWLDTSVVQLLRMQPLCLKHPTSEHAYGEGASKDVHVANSPPRASALASRALDKISQQFSGQASENAGMLTIESIEVRRIDAAPKNRDDEPGALQDAERQRAREQEVEAEEQQKLVHEENEAEAQQDRGASRLQGIFTVAHVNKDHLKEFYSKHSADSVSGPGSPIERAGNSLMAKREKAKQVSPLHK
jgi:Ran GTPase-activating protein (RanGAP) involved in mRNA processing and transport